VTNQATLYQNMSPQRNHPYTLTFTVDCASGSGGLDIMVGGQTVAEDGVTPSA